MTILQTFRQTTAGMGSINWKIVEISVCVCVEGDYVENQSHFTNKNPFYDFRSANLLYSISELNKTLLIYSMKREEQSARIV